MNVFSNLNFQGSSPILEHLDAFPETPHNGQLTLVSGIVYMYTSLKGATTWYPLTNEKNYYVQTQGLASTTWQINHNLGTSDFIFFVYDENNNLIQPDYEYINDDAFKLNFTVARKGKVVLFYAENSLNIEKSYGIKKIKYIASDFQTDFSVSDNLITLEYIDVFINGLLINDDDYTYSTNTLTLNTGLDAGDELSITTYGAVDFRKIGTRKVDFVATDGQSNFIVEHIQGQTDVFINGLILQDDEYTDTASDVTLVTPLNVNDKVTIKMYDLVNSLENYTKIEVDQKVNTDDIVDDVTSTYISKPLSANQGRVLKGLIDNINILLSTDDTTLNDLQEVVNYIKANKSDLQNLSTSNIAGLDDDLNNLQIGVDSKIGHADYATPTVGGTVKLRKDGDTLYITTDGSDA